MRDKTYLVTGASGFIGRNLVRALRASGNTVRSAVRSKPTEPNDYECALDASKEQWEEALDDCDGVFHLAWSTVPSTANSNPLIDLATNLSGTVRMLEVLRNHPGIKLVFASSGGTVYGNPQHLPIREDHPLRPLGIYGANKVSAETFALAYRRQWGVDARIVRLSNPFGPGQDIKGTLGAATIFAARGIAGEPIEIWGDGKIVRDYVFIDDVVRAFIFAMEADSIAMGEQDPVLNVGSGRGISLNQIIKIIQAELPCKLNVTYRQSRGFDVATNVLDISRARALIDWHPELTFEQGMSRHIKYLERSSALLV